MGGGSEQAKPPPEEGFSTEQSDLDITERKRVESELRHREASLVAARQIQERLLPHEPLRVHGLRIRGACCPTDYASGDLFDHFLLPDGTITAVVADVSGHGIDAALLMTSVQARLRSYLEIGVGISESLERLNEVFIHEFDGEGRFLTLILLKIDARSRTLVYTNAGHPPGFVLDRTGAVKASLASLHVPLGFQSGIRFPVADPIALETGDLILLLSDGVIEASAEKGVPFGIERARQFVQDHIDRPEDEIIEGLFQEIRQATGLATLPDDATCVLVRVEVEGFQE